MIGVTSHAFLLVGLPFSRLDSDNDRHTTLRL